MDDCCSKEKLYKESVFRIDLKDQRKIYRIETSTCVTCGKVLEKRTVVEE
jgi:hypothetical protein